MKPPKFCEACGKKLIAHSFEGSHKFDPQTGESYQIVQDIIVCPDHKNDIWPSGHTRHIARQGKRFDDGRMEWE